MKTQTIHIKNMCCQRCIEAVQTELSGLGLKVEEVKLGEVSFAENSRIKLSEIESILQKRGFELIVSQEARIVETVKIILIEMVHQSKVNHDYKIHLPEFLEQILKKPYRSIYKLFLSHTKLTVEKYFILQRIEKVKELIEQDEFNFSEIAEIAGFKTLQHLSAQFKKITGMNMIEYKKSESKNSKKIDEI